LSYIRRHYCHDTGADPGFLERGELTQFWGGDVLLACKARAREVWGHAPQKNITNKCCNLGAFSHITLLRCSSSACVNGKVLVG